MKGTVAPPSSRSTAARTCASATRSSAAICRVILSISTAGLTGEAREFATANAQQDGTTADTRRSAGFPTSVAIPHCFFCWSLPMRARFILLVLAILLVAGFAAQNWAEFNRPSSLNVGVTTVEAPLGLILLIVLGVALL